MCSLGSLMIWEGPDPGFATDGEPGHPAIEEGRHSYPIGMTAFIFVVRCGGWWNLGALSTPDVFIGFEQVLVAVDPLFGAVLRPLRRSTIHKDGPRTPKTSFAETAEGGHRAKEEGHHSYPIGMMAFIFVVRCGGWWNLGALFTPDVFIRFEQVLVLADPA